ncbi:hypothetical protein FFIC_281260 [Fructobacillus ficulneus]|uniref:Uncharacterized protein n=1 Tax=Fructobacillus ficulneus TaxID=157463 RepID=A0A0K8MJS5_9LACO|nr:hypothetical protein FFIC_281260 [Fructobacillus ficulneus]
MNTNIKIGINITQPLSFRIYLSIVQVSFRPGAKTIFIEDVSKYDALLLKR